MIALPTALIPTGVFIWPPFKACFIPRGKLEKPVLGVWGVTSPTPHRLTGPPTIPGGVKVGTEQAVQPRFLLSTYPAAPCPKPKWSWIA